jgi:uncharacterized membrane protein
MKFKTAKIVEWIVCAIMPCILAITVVFKIWYLPLIFFFAAAVTFGIILSQVKEVYQDELTQTIEEKGGKAALNLGCIIMILTGVILLAVSSGYTSSLGIAAITLFAASYGLSIVSLFTKIYYKNKLGGK